MKAGRTVLILLGFEFGVLTISTLSLTARYCLHLIDSNMENGLQSKGLYIMVVNLISDGLKFAVYVIFFVLVFVYYGLPIHILRDLWIAFTNFKQQLVSFVNYLRLSSNLDARFENATPAEILDSGDCLICREGMTRAKKLPCGHLFHLDCLRMWLQHQQTCPLCRANIPTSTTAAAAADAAIQRANTDPVPIQDNNNAPDNNDNIEQQQQQQPVANDNNISASVPTSSSSSTTTAAAASVATATASATSPRPLSYTLHQIGVDIPGFFLVCTSPGTLLRASPSVTETQLRYIKAGTLVFATSRHIAGDGSQWLKLPDGWAMESVLSDQSCNLLLVPYKIVETSQPVSGTNGYSHLGREVVGLSDADMLMMQKSAARPNESSNNNISNHLPSATTIPNYQHHHTSQTSSLPSITISSARLPNSLSATSTSSASSYQTSNSQLFSSNQLMHPNTYNYNINDEDEDDDRETVEVLGGVQGRIEAMAIGLSNMQDELAVMQAMVSGILADKHRQSFRRRLRRDVQSASTGTATGAMEYESKVESTAMNNNMNPTILEDKES